MGAGALLNKYMPNRRANIKIGRRFTKLKVVGFNQGGGWDCVCDCGNRLIGVAPNSLTRGIRKSCGCIRRRPGTDYTGRKIGRLFVKKYIASADAPCKRAWVCLCDCGKTVYLDTWTLTHRRKMIDGSPRSCGCGVFSSKFKDKRYYTAWYTYVNGAKNRNYKWALTTVNFENLITNNCYYCGAAPSIKKSGHRRGNRAIRERNIAINGIDRVDNRLGYTTKNCVSCCEVCNKAKHALTVEEWTAWISRLVAFQGKKIPMAVAEAGGVAAG